MRFEWFKERDDGNERPFEAVKLRIPREHES